MGATGGQEVRIGVQTIQPRRTKMELDRTDAPVAGEYATVYAAFELSKAKWKLGIVLPGSEKMSRYTIVGGDLTALTNRLAERARRLRAAADRSACCRATRPVTTGTGCTVG